jgi:hypothetical protein
MQARSFVLCGPEAQQGIPLSGRYRLCLKSSDLTHTGANFGTEGLPERVDETTSPHLAVRSDTWAVLPPAEPNSHYMSDAQSEIAPMSTTSCSSSHMISRRDRIRAEQARHCQNVIERKYKRTLLNIVCFFVTNTYVREVASGPRPGTRSSRRNKNRLAKSEELTAIAAAVNSQRLRRLRINKALHELSLQLLERRVHKGERINDQQSVRSY